MKSILAYIWNHRWCRSVLAVAILCGLVMLHPFARQSIFGPTIDGIPWCVWEAELRQSAKQSPGGRGGFVAWLAKIGLVDDEPLPLPLESSVAMPLYLHLAEDQDVQVRRFVLRSLAGKRLKAHGPEIMPILWRHLDDDDPTCRLYAADGIWSVTKDATARSIVLSLMEHEDSFVRRHAAFSAKEMITHDHAWFDPLMKLTKDSDHYVRCCGVRLMGLVGRRGLPIIRASLPRCRFGYSSRGRGGSAILEGRRQRPGAGPDRAAKRYGFHATEQS